MSKCYPFYIIILPGTYFLLLFVLSFTVIIYWYHLPFFFFLKTWHTHPIDALQCFFSKQSRAKNTRKTLPISWVASTNGWMDGPLWPWYFFHICIPLYIQMKAFRPQIKGALGRPCNVQEGLPTQSRYKPRVPSKLGPPRPLSCKRVLPSNPEPKGRGRVRGWGTPNSDDWRKRL